VELKLAGEAKDNRNKVTSEASRIVFVRQLSFVTPDCFVTELFFARQLFFVAKLFFVTGTIVPIPIPCAGLPLEAGLIFLLGGTEGGVRRRCRMGFGVARNYW